MISFIGRLLVKDRGGKRGSCLYRIFNGVNSLCLILSLYFPEKEQTLRQCKIGSSAVKWLRYLDHFYCRDIEMEIPHCCPYKRVSLTFNKNRDPQVSSRTQIKDYLPKLYQAKASPTTLLRMNYFDFGSSLRTTCLLRCVFNF